MAAGKVFSCFRQTLLKYATAKEIKTAAGNKRPLTNKQRTKEGLCFSVFLLLLPAWRLTGLHRHSSRSSSRLLMCSTIQDGKRGRSYLLCLFLGKKMAQKSHSCWFILIDNWCCLVLLSIIQNIQLKQKKIKSTTTWLSFYMTLIKCSPMHYYRK